MQVADRSDHTTNAALAPAKCFNRLDNIEAFHWIKGSTFGQTEVNSDKKNIRNQKFDKQKKRQKGQRTILMHKVVKFIKRVKTTDRLTAS